MNGQVTVPLPARRQGRRGRTVGADVAPGPAGTTPAPTPARIPRVARVLALAHHWQGLLRTGAVRNQADLARLVGVSRARVTQVMDLLRLAPDIQADVLHGVQPKQNRCAAPERVLRSIARTPAWHAQSRAWEGLREVLEPSA